MRRDQSTLPPVLFLNTIRFSPFFSFCFFLQHGPLFVCFEALRADYLAVCAKVAGSGQDTHQAASCNKLLAGKLLQQLLPRNAESSRIVSRGLCRCRVQV